jgi:hypothetical protein
MANCAFLDERVNGYLPFFSNAIVRHVDVFSGETHGGPIENSTERVGCYFGNLIATLSPWD